MKKILLCLSLIVTISIAAQEKVVILIHGTWAHESAIPFMNYVYPNKTAKWFEPGHEYYDNLRQSFQAPVVSFLWSGYNKHDHRIDAAQKLVDLICSYPPDTHIIIVSHSHGSNVGFIASQLLAKNPKNRHHICEFYAFGTPICVTSYQPNMDVIHHVCNFFSFEDMIQPVLGMFERVLPEHERITNIRTFIAQKEPDHAELHHPTIARWISCVHEKLKEPQHSHPRLARFFSDDYPQFEPDTERDRLLERDKRLQYQLSNALFRKKNESEMPIEAPEEHEDGTSDDMRVLHHLLECMQP